MYIFILKRMRITNQGTMYNDKTLKRSCRQTLRLIVVLVFYLSPFVTSKSSSAPRRFSHQSHEVLRLRKGGMRRSNHNPPCRVFLWDAPSAIRYHICKRFLRGNVYEGLGGKKFVRIKPNSMLESLYPLSRHGPDRCLICNHSFDNHLRSWWFTHLYKPYDMYLDDTTSRFTQMESQPNGYTSSAKKSRKRRQRKNKRFEIDDDLDMGLQSVPPEEQYISFAKRVFHKRYVKDITPLYSNMKKRKSIIGASASRPYVIDGNYEKSSVRGVIYQVPAFEQNDSAITFIGQSMLVLTRVLVLDRFHSLIIIQDIDNRWNDWKRSRQL